MKRHLSLSFVTSLFAVMCYLTFALLAFAQYPLPYSPMSNWLSDLGNAVLNPHGTLFYNIGIVATGVVLLLFFIGLSRWKMENHSFFSIFLYILLGTAFGFSVAALRYYPTCPRWLLILGALTALMDILYLDSLLSNHAIHQNWGNFPRRLSQALI